MHIGVKALGRGLRKIGTKTMKTVNKIGSKHSLEAIGHVAGDVGKAAGMLSVVAPELGLPLMAAAAGVGKATNMALDAKSSVAAAKRGDMERAASKGKSAGMSFL
tara:strand:+ start:635 stop:949 length:315 start_codon:yes stop_codon:yes gene_type:complete